MHVSSLGYLQPHVDSFILRIIDTLLSFTVPFVYQFICDSFVRYCNFRVYLLLVCMGTSLENVSRYSELVIEEVTKYKFIGKLYHADSITNTMYVV